MIITEKEAAKMREPIGDGEPMVGPDGEMIEITEAESLRTRINSNKEAFDTNMRRFIYLTQKYYDLSELSDDQRDAFDAATKINDILIRGTFETNNENSSFSLDGFIVHKNDFRSYYDNLKVLENSFSDEELKTISEIELNDGKDDIAHIRSFTDDVCKTVTPENVRAVNAHFASYLDRLRIDLANAMYHCSLEGIANTKKEYYDAADRIMDSLAEAKHERNRIIAQKLGNIAMENTDLAEIE